MSKRSSWAAVLLAMVLVLAAGPGWFAARAEGPEPDPLTRKAAAEVRPEKPKGRAAAMPRVRLRYGEKAVMGALAEPATMEFVETPLVDVVAYLQDHHHIHIRLDKKALDDVGIGTDTPITFSISGVPLEAALGLMLRDLNLYWTIPRGVLLITTPEQAESMLSTKTYDVTDLLFPIGDKPYDGTRLPATGSLLSTGRKQSGDSGGQPWVNGMNVIAPGKTETKGSSGGMGGGGSFFNVMGSYYSGTPYPNTGVSADFDSLIDWITSTIVPDSWDEVGGPGSIAPVENTSLVVSQTLDIHRQIEALLDELRARQRGVPTVVIDARWLLLDSEGLDRVLADGPRGAGRLVADAKMLDHLTRTVPGCRGRVACLSGTLTHLVAGDRRSQVTGAVPVVGSGIGYQPVISIPNVGVLLEVRPVVDRGAKTAVLHLASTVTRWGDQPASVSVGGESPPAEIKEPGNESETAQVPASAASVRVDRPNIAAQQVASSLRVPLGQPILIGGLTLDPTEKTAGQQAPGERKQLYLFVQTSVVQAPRQAGKAAAGARRAARRRR